MEELRPMDSKRVVVVTGGGSGIGRATALHFASAGDTVVVADINEEAGTAVVKGIVDAEGTAFFEYVDVANDNSITELVKRVRSRCGAPSVLVNSAGLLQNPARLVDIDMEEHDKIWSVNYRGTFMCCRQFVPGMIEMGEGAIVNISSTSAVRVFPLLAYSPSKSAIDQLTKILSADLGPNGIRVNAVLPGYVRSEQMQLRIDQGFRDESKMKDQSALGRMVEPLEIAEGIYFLCSSAAKAITGTILPIDAGYLSSTSYQLYAGWTNDSVDR